LKKRLGFIARSIGAAGLFIFAPHAAADGTVWSVTSENDLFGGTDRHYTNGLRIERFSPEDKAFPFQREIADFLPFIELERTTLRRGIGLTHAIYTPEDISADVPDPDDRPYAGWLAVSATAVAEQRLPGGDFIQDSLQVNLGIVGPSAMGEQVQENWHEWINGVEPRGWEYQLHDEPGLEIVAQRLRGLKGPRLLGLETDLGLHGSLALGNVRTYGAVGAMMRVGWDLDANFSPPRIRPALAGAGVYDPDDDFGGYVFAGVEGRAIARDIFLDGNTFRDSPSVDKKPFVYEYQAGIAINIYSVQVALSYVDRSEQFIGQTGRQKFGAISISLTH
jgi:lipid A 3-O-deacylase